MQTVKHYSDNSLMPFEWKDVIEEINYRVVNGGEIKTLQNFGMVMFDCERIKNVKETMKKLSAVSADCYVSFSEHSYSYGEHSDDCDVLFWQVIGKTKWDVLQNTYILTENDLIFVPKEIKHQVTPLTPRVGISFGF